MALTIGVNVTILMDSGIQESQAEGTGPQAVVKFKCLTSDRYQLVQDLLGQTTRAGSSITRIFPFAYPPSPNLICRSVDSIEQIGMGFPLGIPAWVGRQYSIVTARFGIAQFSADGQNDASGQPYTSTTFDIGTEVYTVPQSVYKFSGGTPTNTPVGIQIPSIQINMRRFMLPYAPVAEMAAIVGKVNAGVLTVGDMGFAAGTVLFLGGPTTKNADTQGNITYEAEYRFSFRPPGWNKYLHPNGTSGFQTVTDGSGNPPYQSGDLTSLP